MPLPAKPLPPSSAAPSSSSHPTWLEIDGAQIAQNYEILSKLMAPSRVMPIIKSNAYGHDLAITLKALIPLAPPWIGVSNLEEATTVRALGYTGKVLMLGPAQPQDLQGCKHHNIHLCLASHGVFEAWRGMPSPPSAYLKCDVGLSRQGFAYEDFQHLFTSLVHTNALQHIQGLMPHFSNTLSPQGEDACVAEQQTYERFRKLAQSCPQTHHFIYHGGASHASLTQPTSRYDLVRLGILLYGLWPSEITRQQAHSHPSSIPHKLAQSPWQPCLTWKSRIAQIKHLPKGSKVGYGGTYQTPHDQTVGLLPVGYGHGYHRRLGEHPQSAVLIGGYFCPIIGAISMTMLTVALPPTQEFYEGQEAILLGSDPTHQHISAHDLALWSQSIAYEITTCIPPQVPRF